MEDVNDDDQIAFRLRSGITASQAMRRRATMAGDIAAAADRIEALEAERDGWKARAADLASELVRATSGRCPTDCDDDCEADCHEDHAVTYKKVHQHDTCPGVMASRHRRAPAVADAPDGRPDTNAYEAGK